MIPPKPNITKKKYYPDDFLNDYLDYAFGRGNWHSGKVSLNYTRAQELVQEALTVGRREGAEEQKKKDKEIALETSYYKLESRDVALAIVDGIEAGSTMSVPFREDKP